jgi:hypothetical protein
VAWLVRLEAGLDRAQMGTVVEFTLFVGVAGVVVPSGLICGLLRWLVRRWTGITVVDGYRPTSRVRMSTGFW